MASYESTNREPARVGVIGCGSISGIYFTNAARFDSYDIVACADLIPERTEHSANQFNIPRVCSPDELIADPEIDIVLNLTIPDAHASIALAAIENGKSVYNEKPLTIHRDEAKRLLAHANEKGLRIGCAPDTFLGAGLQTVRQLIDDGAIGAPVAATAFFTCHGHEHWHPHPEYYYQEGAGPIFDMGPYYITALVTLLGPVKHVSASTRITFPQRTIYSEPKRGQMFKVNVPTHASASLEFTSGAISTVILSFDVWHTNLPHLEIHGETSSISAPDPNMFAGPVRLRGAEDSEWNDVPIDRPYEDNSRGLGLADMANAILRGTNQPHRASGELAYHVLDIMHAIHEASEQGRRVELESICDRPAPLVT